MCWPLQHITSFQKTTPIRCSRMSTRTSVKKKVILSSMFTLLTNNLGYLDQGKKREGFPNFSHPLIHFTNTWVKRKILQLPRS